MVHIKKTLKKKIKPLGFETTIPEATVCSKNQVSS